MDKLVEPDVKELSLSFTRGQKCAATFQLSNLMHTMAVAVSLSISNPSLSFAQSYSILPPLSTASFTLHLSQPSDHPPFSSSPDTVVVRSAMLPTGKARLEDLRRLFSRPGPHIFKDASIPVSFVGPHVVEFILLSPPTKTLEVAFVLSKAISGCDESHIRSLLCSAARIGNSAVLSALIDSRADINHRDSEGQSLMSLAVQSGNLDSIRILVDAGYAIDHSQDRFLQLAAELGRVDVAEALLLGFRDIDINSIDSRGRTALHVAAIHGHVEMLQYLASVGGDPNAVDLHGWTPLHYAAAEGHKENAEFLLNVSVFAKHAVTKEGKIPFVLAVENGHSHLYNMLQLGDSLQRAARVDDVHAMKSCLAEGAMVNGRDQNGWTPLHRAAFKGRLDSVKLLVNHGAQVDLADDSGRTPLHLAVEAGHLEVATRLIAHGAKANVKGLKFFDLDPLKNHPSLVAVVASMQQEEERA